MRALNRHHVREFNPSQKQKHRGRRKLRRTYEILLARSVTRPNPVCRCRGKRTTAPLSCENVGRGRKMVEVFKHHGRRLNRLAGYRVNRHFRFEALLLTERAPYSRCPRSVSHLPGQGFLPDLSAHNRRARIWEAQSTNVRCARPVNTGWPCCAPLPESGAFEARTFECSTCGRTEKVSISADPFKTNAVGWRASELRPPH
jgi:hypothetical protein